MNLKNKIIINDEIEKVVTDLLLYIEKETDIIFDYVTMGGNSKLISAETRNSKSLSTYIPAEVYHLQSENYSVFFVIYIIEYDGINKVIEIALLPLNYDSLEDVENVTKRLTEILLSIPITHRLRRIENPV